MSKVLRGRDEKILVLQAIRGDANAFGALYTRHLDAIYRYIYLRIGDAAEAEDLTEEVFVRAWETLPHYEPRQHPFTSWLYRIAHNLAVDTQRKRRPFDFSTPDFQNQRDGRPLPEDEVADWQDHAALTWAVQQLGDEEQQVIILRFVEGLSHREVAHIIGKSEGSSRVVQHRALAALHELLSEEEEPDG